MLAAGVNQTSSSGKLKKQVESSDGGMDPNVCTSNDASLVLLRMFFSIFTLYY